MIQEKLNILKENQVIDEEVYNFSQTTLQHLKEQRIIKEDDQADTFITHLAMAMARHGEEEINAVDDTILAEITADEKFAEAKAVWEEIAAKSPVSFHPNESGYFYLHLVTLLHQS